MMGEKIINDGNEAFAMTFLVRFQIFGEICII